MLRELVYIVCMNNTKHIDVDALTPAELVALDRLARKWVVLMPGEGFVGFCLRADADGYRPSFRAVTGFGPRKAGRKELAKLADHFDAYLAHEGSPVRAYRC